MADFEFGIYIGGVAGTESGLTSGLADNDDCIFNALNELQGSAPSFLARCYAGYHGADKEPRTLPDATVRYVTATRKLDLVLCFQANENNMDGWKEFITKQILRFGQHIKFLQITEEANVNLPSLDGHYPDSRKTLVEGIVHAKNVIRELGFSIQVGFNATPDFNPNKTFWREIKELANEKFYASLDYVGLDFFPGVFRALPSNEISDTRQLIAKVIQAFRTDIKDAGINENIPLHITENGFPTNGERSEAQQSKMLSMIISVVFDLRSEFNIHTYELFSLRDADSKIDDVFYQFGIMRDNYEPKQAFHAFKDLIKNYCKPHAFKATS